MSGHELPELTKQQRLILDVIEAYIETYGYAPSIRDIKECAGYRSTSSVQFQLRNLTTMGYLRGRQGGRSRALVLVDRSEVNAVAS